MEDRDILDRIHGLVAESHQLRDLREHGDVTEDTELARLEELEQGIESMWALLRRRRALRAAGLDPNGDLDRDGHELARGRAAPEPGRVESAAARAEGVG